jgi:4-amino-4-deoxy-L-arabinose transferase-like glycosyltransferase
MPESANPSAQTKPVRSHTPTGFSLILALFFTSRLMLLLAFPPENLIFYGDYQHYFNLSDLTRQGLYPFIDYWYEFPPIFPYLNIAVYALAGQQLKNYILVLAFVLLLVECGNLYLIYWLAVTLRGPGQAIQVAWIYTALFIPVFFWLGNFDALTTFFILLGLYSLIKHNHKLLALALGLGTMVKFLPILLIVAIWRRWGLKPALIYSGLTLLISLLIFGPFALANPTMTLASLQAQAGKSSYQTIWALIDGNTSTGNFGPLSDHFDPAKATEPLHNPPHLPTWLTLFPFGALGLYIFNRPQRPDDPNLDTLLFTTLTFIIFFLWSQGWSPQWQTFLIPLLLLTLPDRRAVLFIIVLGLVNFLEWPVMLSRGLNQFISITVIARTLILALIALELYQALRRPDAVLCPSQGTR